MDIKRTDLKCDVLIVGGGIGGLSCAVAVKEQLPDADVLIIEKQTAGYSGKANRGGGVLQYFDPKRVTPEKFLAFHVTQVGCGLGDQELMLKYVGMNTAMLNKLESWGVSIPREEDGSFHVMPTGPMTAITCVDLDITLRIRRRAEKLGVRIMDKTTLAELLTDGKKVSGAVAYSILDGSVYVISAGTLVLATGSQNYRFASMWSNGRGDGIAAAYRAGAKLRNVEFGNFAQLVKAKSHTEVVFGENYMHNAKNENVTKNFRSHRESDINSNAIREWRDQLLAGNGPIHLDFGDEAEESLEKLWPRPYGAKFNRLNRENAEAVDTDLEVCPMFIGEQSPLYVDHDMQTSVSGLYAIGDCSYCGSGAAGAVPAPPGRNRGSGILNAVFAALCCAEGIAKVGTASAAAPDEAQVASSVERTFAPLLRDSGCSAKEIIALVQQAMVPMENSVVMTAERIEKALTIVEQAKAKLPDMKAADYHDLLSCHEAEAMVLSAELHYRASSMRKESRGWFLREDYPEMDNANWRKWIVVQNVNGEMAFTTEDIPLDKCPVYPKGTDPVPITEAERNSPLYKYYARDMVAPDPMRYAEVSAPVDPEKALTPQEMNKLFDEGYLPVERGYCQLPDGAATLANLTFMPGVTVEMFDWWFAWHGLEPMRYKLWDHDDHYHCLTRNPEVSSDKTRSMKERYWDTIHDVVEDTGLGPEHIAINFRNPADVGFDPEKLKNFDGTIVCAGNEYNPVFMCHFLRPVEGGCELRTRFWMGYSIIGGKPVKVVPDGEKFPVEAAISLLMHNIKEFTNLAAILPEIYAEFHEGF
ncbi:MAG: FAD-dependent oxidoreductase [Ruminococcaceae bacterium]|nr:FAD-dependent oxidoreductase [Oscillospiraceae bacterium]